MWRNLRIRNKKFTLIRALICIISIWVFPQQYGSPKFTIMKPNLSVTHITLAITEEHNDNQFVTSRFAPTFSVDTYPYIFEKKQGSYRSSIVTFHDFSLTFQVMD